nr:L,D-transpeptidase family protein [Vibrio eleionomae]
MLFTMRLVLAVVLSLFCCHALADVDLVKVDKSKRRLYLYDSGTVVREYRIALGKNPHGPKRQQGDQRTPEGHYYLDEVITDSQYYKAFHISYPNQDDQQQALQRGVDPGGDIMIHGIKNDEHRPPAFVQSFDWTNGCIALTNQEMDELIELVKEGTRIEIEW